MTVESQKPWDYDSSEYKLTMEKYRVPEKISRITINCTLEAEVPCITKNQQGKVIGTNQSESGKTSDNDEANATIATSKVDPTSVRDAGKDLIFTINR